MRLLHEIGIETEFADNPVDALIRFGCGSFSPGRLPDRSFESVTSDPSSLFLVLGASLDIDRQRMTLSRSRARCIALYDVSRRSCTISVGAVRHRGDVTYPEQ